LPAGAERRRQEHPHQRRLGPGEAPGGRIEFCGERIDGLPTYQIVTRGLSHVLEQRRLFPYLTVEKNLLLGSYQERARAQRTDSLAWVFRLFPTLAERRQQLAHSLSGGEQQMLALGRGLMSRPKFLMIDEPFLGLAPLVVKTILEIIQKINAAGVTLLFIEQNVQLALDVSHRGYVLESGAWSSRARPERCWSRISCGRSTWGSDGSDQNLTGRSAA
jgi:branched-chain amino acid transport system ATP-binding protein